MSADRTIVTIDEVTNEATLKVTVHANEVQCEVNMTVSPIPMSAAEWADVADAISDFAFEHPERF
jgi:hypothetical protein